MKLCNRQQEKRKCARTGSAPQASSMKTSQQNVVVWPELITVLNKPVDWANTGLLLVWAVMAMVSQVKLGHRVYHDCSVWRKCMLIYTWLYVDLIKLTMPVCKTRGVTDRKIIHTLHQLTQTEAIWKPSNIHKHRLIWMEKHTERGGCLTICFIPSPNKIPGEVV